jgi:hypothetical protein
MIYTTFLNLRRRPRDGIQCFCGPQGSPQPPCAHRITRATTGETHFEGFCLHNVLATYLHVHLGSQPQMAHHFVDFCQRQRTA